MPNTGVLGGNKSWDERLPLIKKHLSHRPKVDLGWRSQCRCGGTVYVAWLNRWYCVRCGRWVKQDVHQLVQEWIAESHTPATRRE